MRLFSVPFPFSTSFLWMNTRTRFCEECKDTIAQTLLKSNDNEMNGVARQQKVNVKSKEYKGVLFVLLKQSENLSGQIGKS